MRFLQNDMQNVARLAALEALERCRRDGAWSTAALDSVTKKYTLDHRDGALAARLCLGVLQNSSYCDFYIDRYCSTSGNKIQPKLRDILRLGVYQLLFLDKIPARAAVNETVALCRSIGLERASGLVNAVLRRVSEDREHLPPIPEEGTPAYLSIRYSHPEWLVERLLKEHEYAFVKAFLAANNEAPKLTVQVNTRKVSAEDYMRALSRADIAFACAEGLDGCLILEGGQVTQLPGYEEGLFYIQDRAARSAVAAAGVKPGMRVLDTCAAPGGKSFAAAIDMEDTGDLVSCDIHEKKLRLIEEGAKRLGLQCLSTRAGDARKLVDAFVDHFDLVMTDVPCSGLGVIGKRPEIRNKAEAELSALPGIQADILRTASCYVKPGGVLLYSTCTILPEENQDQIQSFLKKNPQFEAEDFTIGSLRSQNGMYTFWPQTDGTDGFFVAKLKRKG